MADFEAEIGALDDQIADLEVTIAQTRAVSQAFSAELQQMQVALGQAGRQVDGLSRSIGWGLRRAFDGLVFDGMRLSEALRILGQTMVDRVLTEALKPVQNALGSALAAGIQGLTGGLLPFADGAAFSQGRVTPFARGGVISQATLFPMRGGLGLMGEAGPEAIMPLARGADGRLGVRMQGAAQRPVSVVMNIATPDVAGFRNSRTQIAARLHRAIRQGTRNI